VKGVWAWVLGCVLMGPALAHASSSRTQYVGVVNLNEATAAELDLLPGVGEKAAQRILEHRKKRPFGRVEELVRVKGFGKKKFLKLRAHLALSGPTTLKVEKVPASQPPGKEGAITNP
jgi:competence protein ComEA